MLRTIAPVGALLLGVAFLLAGNGLQTTLLPLRASIEAFSPFDIGILGSAYFAGFVAGCLLTARLVRRVGHIRVFTAMVAGASALPLAHVLLIEPWAWWILRAATGFCLAALYLVIESWLNERATNETRGTILSIYTTLNFGVITVGQMMITLYDPAAFPLFLLASILVSLAAIPVALTGSSQPAPLTEVRLRPLRLMRLSPVGLAGCVTVGLSIGAFWGLAPVFATRAGLDTTGVAIFMSVTVIGGALSQWPFGRLSDLVDRRLVIIAVCLLTVIAGLGLFLAAIHWAEALLPMAFVYGVVSFPLYAISVAHVNDLIEGESFVEVMSGLLLVNGLASVFGPLFASGLMAWQGDAWLFVFTAGVNLAMSGFAFLRLRLRPLPAETHSGTFVAVPEASIAVTTASPTLDPRSEEEIGPPTPDAGLPTDAEGADPEGEEDRATGAQRRD